MTLKNKLKGIMVLLALILVLPTDSIGQGRSNEKGGGGPPPWAPAKGYRAQTRHIYFSDHNFYFDLQRNVYIYLSGGKWIVSASLPTMYSKINFKTAKKVELELDTDNPQKDNANHVAKFKVKPKGVEIKVEPGKGNGKGK
ncbi:MAG: hypothetical protein ACLGGV_09520 [Bacteroidia bacterium]